jgi:hypothetical protein
VQRQREEKQEQGTEKHRQDYREGIMDFSKIAMLSARSHNSASTLSPTDPVPAGVSAGFMNGCRARHVKAGGRPCVQSLGNDIEQEADEQSDARTTKCSVNQYPPVPGLPLENGLNQPGTNGTGRNAGKEPALEQERPDACRRAATAYPDEYGRGDNPHAQQNRRNRTCDHANRDADSYQNQHDDENNQTQKLHGARMIRSGGIATVPREINFTP